MDETVLDKEKLVNLLSKKNIIAKEMIANEQINLMLYWYYKTGYKFVPDYAVMMNFPKEEIDYFLKNGKIWSRLMKIKEFSEIDEGKLALLKLAYVYGVFHGNIDSINHLEFLLKGIPLKISKENYELLILIEDRIKNANKYNLILPSKSEIKNYFDIKNDLCKDKLIDSDSKYIFKELYKSNNNYIYSLQFNYQKYPDLVLKLRAFLETWGLEIMLDPFKAYNMVKDFNFKFDPDFKNFFIENIDLILTNYDYMSYLSKIQKDFDKIKKLNSNRKLTIDLALNYVKDNNYNGIDIGNEKMADTIGKIGLYCQEHFEILQQIYNYGKIRVKSSIPRIEGTYKEYSYEILRLDDPLALVIGNLTECCQKLNDNAELCMEHSMVDNNGRLLILKDKIGQIVAQSWIWRNKNIICFDDIEIPNRLLLKIERKDGLIAKYVFAESIYEVYRHIASRLLEIDNQTYFDLLTNKKISKKQYYSLKLNKVIVGLGNNDIANVIKNNLKIYENKIVKPINFNPPVELSFHPNLYLKDSANQYVLLETNEEEYNFDFDTISIYSDLYEVYDENNMTRIELLMLENLRKITDYCTSKLVLDSELIDNKIVSLISSKYNSKVNNTKIIVHPNFCIIYETYEDKINVLDLFFNTKIDNLKQKFDITNIVLEQIKLALIQISDNKKININNLVDEKINLLNKLDVIFEKPLKKVKRYL